MTHTNPDFESIHPRAGNGAFTDKEPSEPEIPDYTARPVYTA